MLDFKAATEFEQTAAHEVSRAEQRKCFSFWKT